MRYGREAVLWPGVFDRRRHICVVPEEVELPTSAVHATEETWSIVGHAHLQTSWLENVHAQELAIATASHVIWGERTPRHAPMSR